MQKSLFKKYLIITMSIVLAGYIVLVSVMMAFFTGFWEGQTKERLTRNAGSIATLAKGATTLDEDGGGYTMDVNLLNILIRTISTTIDADIFITDLEGNRLTGSYIDETKSDLQIPVPINHVEMAQDGFCEFRSDFSGFYSSSYYTIGIPLVVESSDGSGDQVIAGAIFASTKDMATVEYQLATLQIFALSAVLTLGLTFVVVWLFTYKMVKPLRDMSAASKAIGEGNFTVRVPVQSADEIGQLSMALNNMANSLSSVEGMRRSFIANVSHELKTPMTTIGGFIDGILDNTIPKEKQSYYLRIVSKEVKRLSRLVKSMLDLSKIDSGEMKLNPVKFDISATIFSTLLTFETAIEDKEIQILGLEDLRSQSVWGDQDLIHQVIYNLVENAVKFTNDKGYIRFSVADSFDKTFISIENSGQGIDSDDLPMIFDKFYKTDKSRSMDTKGMGLGLYLVKTILKLHCGDICVKSGKDEYCRFELYLPKPRELQKQTFDTTVTNLKLKSENVDDIQVIE